MLFVLSWCHCSYFGFCDLVVFLCFVVFVMVLRVYLFYTDVVWVIRVDCGESIWVIVNYIVIEIAMFLEWGWGGLYSFVYLYYLLGELDRTFGFVS